ncbi:ABC transporter ATPase [Vespertiliibacter pulmonis]|uniref:ABC transporter ATPase n=1 Tax=Vespertiliibacter pulmonis TaxID=1443036 RepID=A0A3N4VWA0_9PAST|nr:DUF5339 domain-containing protein [Vespertiliibacter pulmonis]QLB21277.1 ABC transporter ATPase [Vespertiliibacter pulmonis]RPE85683.1 hypothetical protein EDC46_0061 [Vespertiliibacter pulmonis]
MKNRYFPAILLMSGLLPLAMNSTASELRTSSLAAVKTQSTAHNIAQQCQLLFKEGDKLILEAAKQPGTHIQVKRMKDKLTSSKQQILKMDMVMQQKSCNKGLTALNTLKQKY